MRPGSATASPLPAAGLVAVLAWTALPVAVVLAAATTAIAATGPREGDWELAAGLLLLVGVGCLVAARRPRNPVGWLLAAYGLGFEMTILGEMLTSVVYLAGRDLPGAAFAAWLIAWIWAVGLNLLALAFLHFPDGRLPSRWWRPVRWASVASIGLLLVAGALLWPQRGPAFLEMNTGLPGTVPWRLDEVGLLLLEVALPLAVLSLAVRYRRAEAEQRLQLKWLVPAVVLLLAGVGLFLVAGRGPTLSGGWTAVGEAVFVVGLAGLVVSMALAIFKYRLYDIDRILSRTVAYVLISALLAAVYLGGVVVLRAVLAPVTPEGDLAVAGSTLVVAALFGPVRRRIQAVVDRRFNRARYDAKRAVEVFGQQLRVEVDLDEVASELRATTERTVEPTTATVWLVSGKATS